MRGELSSPSWAQRDRRVPPCSSRCHPPCRVVQRHGCLVRHVINTSESVASVDSGTGAYAVRERTAVPPQCPFPRSERGRGPLERRAQRCEDKGKPRRGDHLPGGGRSGLGDPDVPRRVPRWRCCPLSACHRTSVHRVTASPRRTGDTLPLECKVDARWTAAVCAWMPTALRGRRVVVRHACVFTLRAVLSD